jgi:hypothetical protein
MSRKLPLIPCSSAHMIVLRSDSSSTMRLAVFFKCTTSFFPSSQFQYRLSFRHVFQNSSWMVWFCRVSLCHESFCFPICDFHCSSGIHRARFNSFEFDHFSDVFEHHSFATSASLRRFLASAAGIAFRKVVVSGETNCLTSTTLEGAPWVMCGVEGGLEIFGSVLSKLLRGLFPVFCVG